ncbi:hypothetical protein PoB_005329400, partial [Plakobranchus ocellatus]
HDDDDDDDDDCDDDDDDDDDDYDNDDGSMRPYTISLFPFSLPPTMKGERTYILAHTTLIHHYFLTLSKEVKSES